MNPIRGRGKVYLEQEFISECSFRLIFRHERIDTGIGPGRYQEIPEGMIGTITLDSGHMRPDGKEMILHVEQMRLPFYFIDDSGGITTSKDWYEEE